MNDVKTSKFLSLVLRHKPETIGMKLDSEGWLDINELISQANKYGNGITLDLLHEIVATNDKKRFAISEDGLKIRASQGHSVKAVDLNLSVIEPPDILYHGTVAQFMDNIRKVGLQKRSRNHVHLSLDEATANKVAARRGKPVILEIAAKEMPDAKNVFYL